MVDVQECAGCQRRLFPDRLRCPDCGGREFRRVRVDFVTVQEVTVRPGAERAIATVDAGGAMVIASVPVFVRPGDILG